MNETLSTLSTDGLSIDAEGEVWCLSVVHHAEPGRLGRRLVVARPGEVLLGRHAELLGPDTLRDERVSRSHARLRLDAGGVLSIEDAGSRNGTFVNGERVEQARLSPGDIVALGSVLLLAHRAPPGFLPPTLAEALAAPLVGFGHRVAALVQRAGSLPREPVVIVGEPGVGKETLARHLHRLHRPSGPWVVLDAGAVNDDTLGSELFGRAEGAFPGALAPAVGLLAAADGGTLLVDSLELASPALQAALLRFLDDGEVRPVGSTLRRRVDARVVALSRAPVEALLDQGRLSPAFVDRLGGAWLAIPPLRERREDTPALLRSVLASLGAPEARLDPLLALALLRHPLPGNVRSIHTIARQALDQARQPPGPAGSGQAGAAGEGRAEAPLRLDPPLAAALGASALLAASSPRASRRPLVARSGAWFVVEGGRVELTHRPSLQRVLACLARAREAGQPADTAALLEAGWPGERVLASAGQSRVYAAMATLRRLGLRDAIDHDELGYRLLPGVELAEG